VLTVLLQGTEQLALLLSSAAASLQQPVADGTLPGQQRHLVLNFCLAIKVGSYSMHACEQDNMRNMWTGHWC
jgi:hypothetical protein